MPSWLDKLGIAPRRELRGAPPADAPAPVAVTKAIAPVEKIQIDQLVKDAKLSKLRDAQAIEPSKLRQVVDFQMPGVPYRRVDGGPVELFHGSILEGSIDHGGIQPHYIVDLEDPRIAALMKQARGIRDQGLDFHERCAAVRTLVDDVLSGKKYDEPAYLSLLKNARKGRKNVTPGDYIDVKAGVCREHAMLTHLALREAGVETRYLYVKVKDPSGKETEDHAVALAFDAGGYEAWGQGDPSKAWIVDAYNPMFDGRRLGSFLGKKGSSNRDAQRPGIEHLPEHWLGYSVKLVDYPTYWVPIRAALPPHVDKLKDIDISTLDYSKVRVIKFDSPHAKKWPPAWLRL